MNCTAPSAGQPLNNASLDNLVTPQNRQEVYQVLTDYDAAEHADRLGRAGKLASVQLCVGVAVALFPYTPGLVDSCRPQSNPGWQCGARAATLLAACGAVIVGLSITYSLWADRDWLRGHRLSLAAGLGHGAPEAGIASGALATYAEATQDDRRQMRQSVWQRGDIGP